MTCFGPTKVRTLCFHPNSKIATPSGPLHVRPLMKELIVEICRIGPLMADSTLHKAISEMLRHEIESAPPIPAFIPLPSDEIARKAARLILEETDERRTASELAAEVGCSRRTLERRFCDDSGMSLGRWCQQARLLKSVHLLASNETVAETAFRSGYAGPSAYIHAFRSHFGVTPSSWRPVVADG